MTVNPSNFSVDHGRYNLTNIEDKPVGKQKAGVAVQLGIFKSLRESFGGAIRTTDNTLVNKRSAIKYLKRHENELKTVLKNIDPKKDLKSSALTKDKIVMYLDALKNYKKEGMGIGSSSPSGGHISPTPGGSAPLPPSTTGSGGVTLPTRPGSQPPIKINLDILPNQDLADKTLSFVVAPKMTAADLKAAISQKIGAESGRVILSFKGKIMNDSDLLDTNAAFKNDLTLQVAVRPKPASPPKPAPVGVPPIVKPSAPLAPFAGSKKMKVNGIEVEVELSLPIAPGQTVRSFKEVIAAKLTAMGTPTEVSQITIYLKEKKIDDNASMIAASLLHNNFSVVVTTMIPSSQKVDINLNFTPFTPQNAAEILPFTITPETTIADLRAAISENIGDKIDLLHIGFNNKVMQDGNKIAANHDFMANPQLTVAIRHKPVEQPAAAPRPPRPQRVTTPIPVNQHMPMDGRKKMSVNGKEMEVELSLPTTPDQTILSYKEVIAAKLTELGTPTKASEIVISNRRGVVDDSRAAVANSIFHPNFTVIVTTETE